MDFCIFSILFLIGACVQNASAEHIITFGDLTEARDTFILSEYFRKPLINAAIPLRETFVYPGPDWQGMIPMIIDGIKVRSLSSTRPEITIVQGSIGEAFANIRVVAAPGENIDCIFYFYVSSLPEGFDGGRSDDAQYTEDNEPENIANFIETEIDIHFMDSTDIIVDHSMEYVNDNSSSPSSSSSSSSYSISSSDFDSD